MYFMESINSPCPMLAAPCASWEDYSLGKCFDCENKDCFKMGLQASKGNTSSVVLNSSSNNTLRKYYLTLGSRRPYCKYHYLLTFTVENGFYGKLSFTLVGEMADSWKISFLNKELQFASGKKYSYVFGERDVGLVTDIVFQWEALRKVFKPYSWFFWRKPTLTIKNILIKNLETGQSSSCYDKIIYLKHNTEFTMSLGANCQSADEDANQYDI